MRLAPEGRIIVLPLFFITGILIWLWSKMGVPIYVPTVLAIFMVFCTIFFRDPLRIVPKNEHLIIAPADGKIIKIETITDNDLGDSQLVSIFLNVFNVHTNRMPIKGTFSDVKYVKGKFLIAFDHKASDENERTEITISSKAGTVKVKQIAGLIARRIICYAKHGEKMDMGGRLGYIKFGSRTDLILPNTINLTVELGQKVVGNSTIIGTFQ